MHAALCVAAKWLSTCDGALVYTSAYLQVCHGSADTDADAGAERAVTHSPEMCEPGERQGEKRNAGCICCVVPVCFGVFSVQEAHMEFGISPVAELSVG